jgi:putative hydrolase of HD superfamily
MTVSETRQQIMESDEFVLSELNKLRTLYESKNVIRYGQTRVCKTESVAEHLYAIHSLIDYFIPLEDPEGEWNALKIHQMAQYHDLDEIETGDIMAIEKTSDDYAKEAAAANKVIEKLPESIQSLLKILSSEFDSQITNESKIVKAVDKIESVFQMYSIEGKIFLQKTKHTRKTHEDYKGNIIDSFPVIKRFETVMADVYEKEGFYFEST